MSDKATPEIVDVIIENRQLRTQVESLRRERDRLLMECDNKARELVAHREKAQGNYWAWQGDGNDHLESLSSQCPVVISAHQLHALQAGVVEAVKALEWLHRHCMSDDLPYRASKGHAVVVALQGLSILKPLVTPKEEGKL